MSLSSEDKLLLCCARTSMSEDITHKVKGILNDCLNWDYIMECSTRHKISPLLYWNLRKIDDGKNVPEEVMAKLRRLYYENAARNRLLYDELSKVFKVFKDVGVTVIVLKGAFLAETIYKNVGLRQMSDINLLIKKEDLYKVKKELDLLMYHAPVYPTKWHEQLQTEQAEEIHFTTQDKNIRIDVHWDIQPPSSPFRIDIDMFWENAQPIKIPGVETLVFAPEDLLQHLCLHLDKEINKGKLPLRWYCDIAEVIRYYEEKINWKYLVQSTKNYGIEKPIYQSLYLVNKYFGAFVPMDVLNDLKTVKSSVDFEDIFRSSRTMEGDLKKKTQQKVINYLQKLTKVNGIGNKAHILFGDVFPCKEFMMHRYPIKNKRLIGVYYLIRFGTALHWGINVLWQLLLYPFKFKLKSKKA